MRLRAECPKRTAAVWIGPTTDRAVLESEAERKSLLDIQRLVWHWTEEPRKFAVDVLVDGDPEERVAKRAKKRTTVSTLTWEGGTLQLGFLPYSSGGKFPDHPPPVPLRDLPPGEYRVSVLETSWTMKDEERFTKEVIRRAGRTRWRLYNAVEGVGCLTVLLGLVVLAGVVIAGFKERFSKAMVLAMGVSLAVAVCGTLLSRALKRLPYLKRVNELGDEVRATPEWAFPELTIVVRSPESDGSKGPLSARLSAALVRGMKGATDAELEKRLNRDWQRFEAEGPFAHVPLRRFAGNLPWEDSDLTVYGALYPNSIADDLVGFEVYANYSSSIQQDLIGDLERDQGSFHPEPRQKGVRRLMKYLRECDVLEGREEIQEAIRELELPPGLDWLQAQGFKCVLSNTGKDGFDWVASTADGYVMLFAVDG